MPGISEGVRYRHWRNRGQGGDSVFITTTCLDFVHAFDREDVRSEMCRFILSYCARHRALLSAFAVMSHHVHLLLRLPEKQAATHLMREFKRRSSWLVRRMLSPDKLKGFEMQVGLNRNRLWQRSFRSVVVFSPEAFGQKVSYIHDNPVRAEIVPAPEDYLWSSAWMWKAGLWDDERGLALDTAWPS